MNIGVKLVESERCMHFVISNAILWPGDGREFVGYLVVQDKRIEAVEPGEYVGALPTVDCKGLAVSPGMIDLMVLGGFDLSILRDDPAAIAGAYLRLGVTACQFCIGTLPFDSVRRVAQNVARAIQSPTAHMADILGLYLEGPFQKPELTGASMREYALSPTAENIQRIIDLGTAISMVNVAPGLDGAPQAVRTLRSAGKTVSMAHSDAAEDAVLECVDAGTTVLGHIWDNNSGRIGDSGVQQPTLEHVALTDERVQFLHLICDGTHVRPTMVRLTLRCRGTDALCLVTDAVIRAGCPDGPYTNDDGRPFIKRDGVGRTDKGWLAGSALLLPDHLRTFARVSGLPASQAIRTVTLNPATSIGVQNRMGLLAPGRQADIVAWDPCTLSVKKVWKSGSELADVSPFREVD
jgi:N-acetylglucosamine-6-phosphate deacetylase